MKKFSIRTTLAALSAAGVLLLGATGAVRAQPTDLTNVPLPNVPSASVLPNLMYILDDSGSMAWDYMPDNIFRLTTGQNLNNCKTATATASNIAAAQCASGQISTWGEPPYYAAQFNQIYYNPNVTYSPGVDSLGVSRGAANPTAAIDDGYLNTGVLPRDLTTKYSEIYYCNIAAPTAAQLTNTSICQRNGIDNITVGTPYFLYWSNNTAIVPLVGPPNGTNPLGALPVSTGTLNPTTNFNQRVVSTTGHPYYFTITPQEYCSDGSLVNCALATASGASPGAPFTVPAPVRYCGTTANAAALTPVSDAVGTASPKCQAKFDVTNYPYPRYGRFFRTDIVPTTTTYPKSAAAVRVDCAAAGFCTYTEELQNFANWYTYYRTRLSMMKTATGHAFVPIDDRYRVGFITINPNNPVTATKYLALSKFDSVQRAAWYNLLYAQSTNGSTPLRQALSRVGRHYAGVLTGINSGMTPDPVQYSCQQNYALLTTDGYYNDTTADAVTPAGTQVGNQDNVADGLTPPFVDRAKTGTLDALGAAVTASTPTTIVEQQICSGTATTTFGSNSGTQQACGCAAGQSRIVQRTTTQTASTTTTEGVPGATTSTSTYAFQNMTACVNPSSITTTITGGTKTEILTCTRKASTVTFSDGATQTCSCNAASPNQLIKQTKTGVTQTVVTVNGVTQSITYSGGAAATYTRSNGVPNASTFTASTACGASSLTAPSPNIAYTGGGAPSSVSSGTVLTLQSPNPQTTNGVTSFTSVAGGTANTLADVSMYYYKNDLRTSGPLATNNVPGDPSKDFTNQQHMTTFTLGLGLQGLMTYSSGYESDPASDFSKIRNAATGCAWSGAGTCDWPAPVPATPSALDDLWHAAVNGRGVYYSASDPNSLADSLSGALAALKTATGAASAAAVSNPVITTTNELQFVSTFRTQMWDGRVIAQKLDPVTGVLLKVLDPVTKQLVSPIVWDTNVQMAPTVSTASDTRTIYMFSPGSPNNLKSFTYGNLTSSGSGGLNAQQQYFVNQCPALSQCPTLSSANQAIANDGNAMVNYLRGQKGNETTVFRARDFVMGDLVDSAPAFVPPPSFGFADTVDSNGNNLTPAQLYSTFKTNNATRQQVLYIGGNDGMLHALNASTGDELWAYIPNVVIPTLSHIASETWGVQHKYSVDGDPVAMDVYDTSAGAWKTILVGALNGGGRGYFALDITNPNSPKGMWEICSDNKFCRITDSDMGFSFGDAVITKRKFDGKWVVLVTSGYNNISGGGGHGLLYVLDAISGTVLAKVDTGVGSGTTPSGLGQIAGFADNFGVDNTTTFAYSGDLYGNLWRFDMSQNPPAVMLMATLVDTTGKPQSITTRPELGIIKGYRVVFVGTGRYLGSSDLVDPATLAPPEPFAYQNTIYAIKDTGSPQGNPRSQLVQQTLVDNGGTTRTISNNPVDFAVQNGWYIDLNPGNSSPGERVNLNPQLVVGTLVVISNVPNNNVCSAGGDSFTYNLDFRTGSYVLGVSGNVAGTKTTGQIIVGFTVTESKTGQKQETPICASGYCPPSPVPPNTAGGGGRRVGWREFLKY